MPNSDPNGCDRYRAAVVRVPLWDADDPPGVDFLYGFLEVLFFRPPGEGGEEDIEVFADERREFSQGADFG